MNNGKLFSYLYGVSKNANFFAAKNSALNLYQGSRSIRDPEVLDCLNRIFNTNYHDNWHMQKTFVNEFASWQKLDLSKYDVDYSAGTTQSFDSFYFRHRHKRFRCYVGEYFYHIKAWISNNVNWSFVSDDNPLQQGDALVLSYPFCDSGNFYEIKSILEECDRLNIPVLIDMAYYNLTSALPIEFENKCIDTVCFSLSKTFPVANYRIGVRYTQKHIQDGQKLHDQINYNNYASCYIGYKLISKFSKDFIANKYRSKQVEVCNLFDINTSNSVIFAIGDSDWDCYSRKTLLDQYQLSFDSKLFKNRICLNSVYENWDLFMELKNEVTTTF
jgi:hypothetical protein